eukprot:jgi/Botrbrau1/23447/Bobra.106_1s0007.1
MAFTAQLASVKPFAGQQLQTRARNSAAARTPVVCRAQQQDDAVPRRAALGMLMGAAAIAASPAPSEAAYGETAKIFGSITNKTGFIPYQGEGFSLLLPAKWNPSKERPFAGIALRYEDNFDAVNNVTIIAAKADKGSIDGYGDPAAFLNSISYVLGEQVFAGETLSEGGFKPNKVVAASLLDVATAKDKSGVNYYKYDILTRTADGDEGGRHHLITAAVGPKSGQLYICDVQIGDKRWFKGAKKEAEGITDSFTVV